MEAVKQGSACIGLKSNKYAVLAAYRRYFDCNYYFFLDNHPN